MKLNSSLHSVLKRERLWDVAFVAPQLLVYVCLTILPLVIAIPMVLTDRVSFVDQDAHFIGLANFVSIFKTPYVQEFIPALWRTALFTVSNYAMVWIFGMGLALLMFEFTGRFQKGFFTVIYLPYMLSGLGIGMLLVMLFSRDTGSVNLLLKELGIVKNPLDYRDPMVAIFALPVIAGWRYAGFNMAIFLSGLLAIPRETIEAARVDGVSYLQQLRYVYFPQMVPSIMIASILCLIGSFGLFDELVGLGALYGNRSAWFLSIILYRTGFFLGSGTGVVGRLSEAIAMSIVVYVPLLVVAVFLTRLQKRLQEY